MKNVILTVAVAVVALSAPAQDKIFKHSGEVIDVKILKISDQSIIYRHADKELQESVSRIAVDHIVYATGTVEKISDKVIINGAKDWEKVQVIEDKERVEGLKKGVEITGKTSAFNWRSTDGSGKKALEKLKQQAAESNAPFVLLTSEHDTQNQLSFGAKGMKKGFLYSYN